MGALHWPSGVASSDVVATNMNKALIITLVLVFNGTTIRAATAESRTRVVLYTVTDPYSGHVRPGYIVDAKATGSCWTGSIAATRPDAWRCMVANEIHDPCFAPAMNTSIVYCPEPRNVKHLLAIELTKPLPLQYGNHRAPPASGTPTQLILAGGVKCGFATGATGVVAGMRINYGCSDGRVLLGDVDRSFPRWRIYSMQRADSSDVTLVDIDTAIY